MPFGMYNIFIVYISIIHIFHNIITTTVKITLVAMLEVDWRDDRFETGGWGGIGRG